MYSTYYIEYRMTLGLGLHCHYDLCIWYAIQVRLVIGRLVIEHMQVPKRHTIEFTCINT